MQSRPKPTCCFKISPVFLLIIAALAITAKTSVKGFSSSWTSSLRPFTTAFSLFAAKQFPNAVFDFHLFSFFLVLPLYCYQPISLHPRGHMLSHVIPWTVKGRVC